MFIPPKKGAIPKDGVEDTRESFDVRDFYGVGIMPYKKDDKVGISLFYDYSGKNSIKSNTIKIPNDKVLEIWTILNEMRAIKAKVVEKEIDLDKMAETNIEEETEGENDEIDF